MKNIIRILKVLIVIIFVLLIGFFIHGRINKTRYLNSENSFLLENSNAPTENIYDFTKSLVQITIETHTGSGIVVDKTTEDLIIISNCHLLENGAKAKVRFDSGNTYEALVYDLSYDYDIGFCKIKIAELDKIDREIQKAVFYDYGENEEELKMLANNKLKVFHAGINTKSDEDKLEVITFEGIVTDYIFKPEFYEMMIVSEGYSRPGMSGGGVFTEDGRLLGILSGGEELEDKSFVTYSVPVKSQYR